MSELITDYVFQIYIPSIWKYPMFIKHDKKIIEHYHYFIIYIRDLYIAVMQLYFVLQLFKKLKV